MKVKRIVVGAPTALNCADFGAKVRKNQAFAGRFGHRETPVHLGGGEFRSALPAARHLRTWRPPAPGPVRLRRRGHAANHTRQCARAWRRDGHRTPHFWQDVAFRGRPGISIRRWREQCYAACKRTRETARCRRRRRAALAAGETPSPEVVAAARETEDVRAGVAAPEPA